MDSAGMNFIQMQQLIVSWYRDGTIDYVRPIIVGRALIGFDITVPDVPPEHVPVEATHEEMVRLLRTFSFNKSNYYSAQLVTPKARGARSVPILPEYRNARPSPIVGGEELYAYIKAIGQMQIGDKLEVGYTEPRPRVTKAINLAAAQLGYTIQFLAGSKGLMRMERLN